MTEFEMMHTPMTNWDEVMRRKKKIVRCEFCNADVSTPYKGVHDETELISGIPVRCRNNGKLNIHIWHGSTGGWGEPKEGFKWFVEHPETHLWWSGYKWTNDPLEAFGCDLESVADRYARFQKIEKYIITEHEFVSPSRGGGN